MPDEKIDQVAKLAKQIADHQARIQVIAANWWSLIVAALDATEKKYLAELAKGLAGIHFIANDPGSLARLRQLCEKLAAIRAIGWLNAQKSIRKEMIALAENEQHWARRIAVEMGAGYDAEGKLIELPDVPKEKKSEKTLPDEPKEAKATPDKPDAPKPPKMEIAPEKEIEKIVDNGLAEGKTVKEWFKKLSDQEAAQVEAVVRQGISEGKSIDQISADIGGTAKNNFEDGVLNRSRTDSQRMARTITNALANNAKLEFCRRNARILVGVEILATLDGRTCPVCAGVDRMRFKLDEPIPSLPLHHNCRCLIVPVTPLSDQVSGGRPMANADFMAEAKRAYEKKYPGKKFDDLAESTKKKYYHQAMRDYEKRTGNPAYTYSEGSVSFKDYFENHMTAQQQKDWLGPERYEIWERGNLPLDKFIPPYPNPRLTVEALKELDKQSFAA